MTADLPKTATPSDLATAARQLLAQALERHHPAIALACSFSVEDLVVLDLLLQVRQDARVFAIDTGRLPEATYACADRLRFRYPDLRIEWYFPRHEAAQVLLATQGPYSFRDGLEARHTCCGIRKVEPLGRALAGLTAWITGMRREQSVSRTQLQAIETDTVHGGIAKYNPLADWSADSVWAYAKEQRLPWSKLYDQGYRSIGCEPCTRAVHADEDERAGRWWWENPEHKECGLHVACSTDSAQL